MSTRNGELLNFPKGLKVRRLSDYKRTLRRRIQRFELRYEMSTERMLERTATGELRETAEISQWQYDADVLADLEVNGTKRTSGSGLTARSGHSRAGRPGRNATNGSQVRPSTNSRMTIKPPKALKARRLSDHKRTLRRRIRRFELRYEMTTEQMLERTANGKLRETAEISQWQYDADVLDFLTAEGARNTAGSGLTATR